MRGKFIVYFFALLLAPLFILTAATDLIAYEVGKIELHGYVENQTAVRLEDQYRNRGNEKGDLARFRSTFVVEAGVDLTDSVKANAIFKAYYEGSWDMDSNLIQTPKDNGRDSVIDGYSMHKDVLIREYFIRKYWKHSSIKVGAQQIVWGESDLLRMSDIINPLDLSHRIFLEDFENVRIPLRAIDFRYEMPGPNRFMFEAVIIPEDFKAIRIASSGANWNPLAYRLPNGLADIFAETMASSWREYENQGLRNLQGGIRLKAIFGEWDFGVFAFHKRVEVPVAVVDKEFLYSGPFLGLAPAAPGEPAYTSFLSSFMEDIAKPQGEWSNIARIFSDNVDNIIDMKYPWINTFGICFNVPEHRTGSIIRFESAFILDNPISYNCPDNLPAGLMGFVSMLPHILDPTIVKTFDNVVDWAWPQTVEFELPAYDYKESDVLQCMIGFDRPTWLKLLNPNMTWFITGQLFYKKIMDHDETMQTGMGEDGHGDQQLMATLIGLTEYYNGYINPEAALMYDFESKTWLIRPQVRYQATEDLSITLGALWIGCKDNNGLAGDLGGFAKDDEAYLHVRYTF